MKSVSDSDCKIKPPVVVNYSIGANRRTLMIPPGASIDLGMTHVFRDRVKAAAKIRSLLHDDQWGDFLLLDPDGFPVGCTSLNMRALNDAMFAWLNCLFAEIENVVLAFVLPEFARAPA
jgi:hypothetical protein